MGSDMKLKVSLLRLAWGLFCLMVYFFRAELACGYSIEPATVLSFQGYRKLLRSDFAVTHLGAKELKQFGYGHSLLYLSLRCLLHLLLRSF